MTDGRTDGQTDGRTDGGDCNIPIAFLKKRGDNQENFHPCQYSVNIFYFLVLFGVLQGSGWQKKE